MAFKEHRLEKVSGFGAVSKESKTLSNFLYVTTDTIAQVIAANYFNGMADKGMQIGDRILVSAGDGNVLLSVTANDGTTVAVKKSGTAAAQHTTVDENDTVVTGLSAVVAVVATLNDDPVDGCQFVTADIGDQAGAPAAGSFLLKSWKNTDADATHVAASTFGKKVNWIAFGY